jgi:hypothetical protein
MENLERIENYLNNTLNESERMEYENELESNDSLRDTQLRYILAKDAIAGVGVRNVVAEEHRKFMSKRTDNQTFTEKERKPMGKQIYLFTPMRIAASILLILSVYTGFQYATLSNESVLDGMSSDYNPSVLRGANDNLQNIRNDYKYGKFENVISAIANQENLSSEMIFLRAMSNYNLKNYQASLQDFETLRKQNAGNSKPSYVYEIEYYEALALVGNGKYDLAISQLEKIKNNESNPYRSLISEWDILKIKALKTK